MNETSCRKHGFNDDLLKDFSDIQKEFIITEVYPSLKQALLNVSNLSISFFVSHIIIVVIYQFVQKSIESNLFEKKMKKLEQVQMASDFNQNELD